MLQSLNKKNYIYVPFKKEFIKVYFNDIYTIQADGNFVKINTKNNSLQVLSNLTQFTSQLPKDIFVRIHKSWSINLNKIEKFTNDHLVIKGEIIPIGSKYKKRLFNILKQNTINRTTKPNC